MQMQEKSVIVLKALLLGIPVEIKLKDGNKQEICLSEDKDVCVKALRTNMAKQEVEEVLIKTEETVAQFIKMCDRIEDDDMVMINANLVLNSGIMY